MKIRIEEYIRDDGGNPYQTWFDGLDAQAAAKVTVAKTRLELGNTSNIEWFRGIGEYKIGAGLSHLPRQRRRSTDYSVWWQHQERTAEGDRSGGSPA